MKTQKRYDYQSLHEERKYGFFWYNWLWNLLRPALIAVAALILVAGVVLTGWNALGERFFWPVDAGDTVPVSFMVESGASLTAVSNQLEAQGLIRNRSVLKYLMDFQGLGQKVQAGEYQLTKAMTLQQIIDRLTTGDGNPLVRDITIIPGWRAEQIADYLVSVGVAPSREAFLTACNNADAYRKYYYIEDMLKQAGVESRLYLLEGYLAPDTYEIYTTATMESVMEKLISQIETVFNADFHTRAQELNMTMDQVLTLASIIEKEAKAADFAKVSAVFHGRLAQNMPLGSDVTLKYYSRSEKMALSDADLSVASPYNSYTNTGLPAGPICSPSKPAIQAALYPDEAFMAEGYLYFCSTSPQEGTLHFSRTLEEHEQASAMYRPLWEAYDRERGL